MVTVFEGGVLAASEFCGESEIDDGGPSLDAASIVPCDLIGAKVIWEVYT